MGEMIELYGRVEDIFGHRLTVAATGGKYLIDLTPHAEGLERLAQGAPFAVKGEKKASEIKAKSFRIGDGEWVDVAKGKKHKAHDAPHVTDEEVATTLEKEGYGAPLEIKSKHKRLEVVANKDNATYKLHIHKGGVVKKVEPLA